MIVNYDMWQNTEIGAAILKHPIYISSNINNFRKKIEEKRLRARAKRKKKNKFKK